MKAELIYQNHCELLLQRGWLRESVTNKYDIFTPPATLEFSEKYRLYLYNRHDQPGYEGDVAKSLEILSQIYGEDIDELHSMVVEDKEVLAVRVEKDGLEAGRAPISMMDTMIRKTKELLHEAANFSLIRRPHYFEHLEEAERYLNQCVFLKSAPGSVIHKIQLPNREEIKEQNLFEQAVTGHEVNDRLMGVASFVNEQLLGESFVDPTDEFLVANRDHINVNLASKLRELYSGVEMADVQFSLSGVRGQKTTAVKDLNKEKLGRIVAFSKTVRERMKEIGVDRVYGKIVELRSKDVEGDRNTIVVEAEIKHIKSHLTLTLASQDIKSAAEAFKQNRIVAITGVIEKEKTQHRVVELQGFEVLG